MESKITDNDVETVYVPTGVSDEKIQLKPDSGRRKADTLFLYFSVFTASVLMFTKGCCSAWISPVIPQLQSNDSDVNPLGKPISTIQISLLAGVPEIFMVVGTLSFGKLPDIIGRKITLICISLGLMLSNVAIALGNNFYVYFVGRSTAQLCIGLLLVVLPMYLNEICEDHNRAKHGCLMMSFLPLGGLYGFLVGPFTSVRWFSFLCGAHLIPQVILFCLLVPESPFYTAAKGDKATTILTLKKLRNNKSAGEITQDYIKIEILLKTREKAIGGRLKDLFETRALRKGLLIGLVVGLSQFISGVHVIMKFSAPIFNEARVQLSGNMVAILGGVVKLIFFFITVTIVGKLGRRPLLLFSSSASAVSLMVLSIYFYLNSKYPYLIDSIRWLPIVVTIVYFSAYALGLGPIPNTVVSELFPNDLRSKASSFVMTAVGVVSCIMVTSFPLLSEYFGIYFCTGIFCVSCFLCFVFFYSMLPETRGKSFLAIQDLLSK